MAEQMVLDADKPQAVVYCVPLWLRDEQIKLAIARVKGRIAPHHEPRAEPVAVVGFGPSLRQTWEQVKDFRYIISCSGSHKFLLEHGIVPTWHVEVDPRPHKVALIGAPHPDVEYLIASACHPKVFDHLEGMNVKLWHIFDARDEGMRLLPPGEWAITGGSDVGMRAMSIAAFLGFRDLHIFGMDGCFAADDSHADAHPNMPKQYAITHYEGVEYRTTPALLECARQVWHELDQMSKVKATFYGEGLVQAMAKHYRRKKPQQVPKIEHLVGVMKEELISADYRRLNQRLHHDNLAFGVGGGKHAEKVQKLVEMLAKQYGAPPSVLDYGCGKGYLAKALPFPIWEYDPAIPGKEETPRAADLVICTDVLEHIEPDRLFMVLADLRRCVLKVGYFTINTKRAKKEYANGQNTHLIQEGAGWWRGRLEQFFSVAWMQMVNSHLHVVVGPRIPTKKEMTV